MSKKSNNFSLPKRVIRFGIEETNSSSSHSLSICENKNELIHRGDPDFNLDIRDDNVLYVSNDYKDYLDFGWGWEKYNDCKAKLYYVAGLAYNCAVIWLTRKDRDHVGYDYKKITKLKYTLCDYLKVNDVIFEWDEDYLNDEDCESILFPQIDHQSIGSSYEQIFESKQSIINFIFSRKSWLYVGNDNGEKPYESFYKESIDDSEGYVGILRVDFGDHFCQRYVDTPFSGGIPFKTDNYVSGVLDHIMFLDIIDTLCLDSRTGNVSLNSFGMWAAEECDPSSSAFHRLSDYKIIQDKDGNLFLMFFNPRSVGFMNKWNWNRKSELRTHFGVKLLEDLEVNGKVDILDLLTYRDEGKDFFLFPITCEINGFNIKK